MEMSVTSKKYENRKDFKKLLEQYGHSKAKKRLFSNESS